MGWFSTGNSAPANGSRPSSNQVIQKSHHPLNITPGSDIDTTLHQITDSMQEIELKVVQHDKEEINKSVTEFVSQRPGNMFVIDGEKDKPESIICTSNTANGKTCLKLGYNQLSLFTHMQKLSYFCSLPQEMEATYFECRKIE